MTEKGNKSIKPIQAQSEPLGSLRHSLTGFGILENAYRLNDAWRKDSLELILKRSAETVSSITAGLRNLGVDQERVFALLEKIRVSWNEPNEKQSLLTPDEIHRNGPAWSDASAVIFTPEDAPGMLEIIRREISQSKRVWVASAFYSPGVINLLLSGFIRFTQNGGDLRVLTSTMGNFNRPDYLVHLRDTVPSIKVKVYHPHDLPFDKTPPPFHPKAWLFQRRDGKGALLIGSSNFTEAGFLKNLEWNYFSAHEVNIPFGDTSPFETALSEFTRYWDRESVEISEEFLSAYRERWHEPDAGRADSFDPPGNWSKPSIAPRPIVQFPVSVRPEAVPNPAQKEALFNLSRMRGQGIRKAAVIAATGVGKTHLAAFDYKESGLENVLFIAHRENILLKGRETFRSVLNDDLFGEFLGAGQEVRNGSGAVFAMIQTLSRQENLDRFSPEHFDYLVVDEFHRGMAPTYLKAIAYFKPRFMLCLTATPERMDGRDVLRLCDYNVAYEARLLDAVDKGWLCPFQYFAVYDETDYRQIAWRGTHYDDEQLTKALSNDTRTAIVAANLRKYLPSNGKTKALAFCSSVYHAHYTAERLTLDHGIDALALSGNNSGDERSAALDRLTDENDRLQVICTVNIFNEGVDIPNLSHVLLLRPTQSFTVFLQQLGRGLRNAPSKEYLVVIDFVGNFKKAHVAPLALSGYTSVQEFMTDGAVSFKTNGSFVTLPRGCYLDPDLEAKRIWDREIRTILTGRIPVKERLKALYSDIRADLEGASPSLTDFLENAYHADPYVFIRHFGNWLRTKLACEGSLNPREQRLLDTRGEAFLGHLEKGLSPVKSYKMVVLTCLLKMGGSSWVVDDIAKEFRGYFLAHRDRLFDYDDLADSEDPERFPLSRVRAKLLQMPLNYLSNTDTDWFVLDREQGTFALKPEVIPYWEEPFYRELVEDRVQFGMVRYFSRKGRVVEVEYDKEIFQTGFPVGRNFAVDFFSEKPMKPGEKRRVQLKVKDLQYDAFFRRSETGKEYRIAYDPEDQVVQALEELLGSGLKKGETAFTLRISGKKELILELPQKSPDLRGILVEIPFAVKIESGYTAQFRRIFSQAPDSREWSVAFEKPGYTGNMEIEITGPERFSAWTGTRYDDPTRFPARIKAAATGLFVEGFRGMFEVEATPKKVRIVRGRENY